MRSALARLRHLARNLSRRGHVEADLDAEVRAHLELLVAQRVADGIGIRPSLTLDSVPYTIVGVMASSFRFPHLDPAPQLWLSDAQAEMSTIGRWRPYCSR